MIGELIINRLKLQVALVLVTALCVLLPVGFADNPPTTYVVTQDQASLLFYQDGKLAGVEPLAKGTAIRAESISGDMVLTTYKGKAACVQLKFLTIQDSVLVVAGDNTELFYYNDSGPTGLERLPKWTQITVEKESHDQVFTTYRGKPAYIKRQFLVTQQEFNSVAEKEAAAKREKAARALAEAQEKADYAALTGYKLNPNQELTKEQYVAGIAAFQNFLKVYPKSIFTGELNNRIAAWQVEADNRENGLVKTANKWMTPDAKAKLFSDWQKNQQIQLAQKDVTSLQAKLANLQQLRKETAGALTVAQGNLTEAKSKLASLQDVQVPIYETSWQKPPGVYTPDGKLKIDKNGRRASYTMEPVSTLKGYNTVPNPEKPKQENRVVSFQNNISQLQATLASLDTSIQDMQAHADKTSQQLASMQSAQQPAPAPVASPARLVTNAAWPFQQPAPAPVASPATRTATAPEETWLQKNWKLVAVIGLVIAAIALSRLQKRNMRTAKQQTRRS